MSATAWYTLLLPWIASSHPRGTLPPDIYLFFNDPSPSRVNRQNAECSQALREVLAVLLKDFEDADKMLTRVSTHSNLQLSTVKLTTGPQMIDASKAWHDRSISILTYQHRLVAERFEPGRSLLFSWLSDPAPLTFGPDIPFQLHDCMACCPQELQATVYSCMYQH